MNHSSLEEISRKKYFGYASIYCVTIIIFSLFFLFLETQIKTKLPTNELIIVIISSMITGFTFAKIEEREFLHIEKHKLSIFTVIMAIIPTLMAFMLLFLKGHLILENISGLSNLVEKHVLFLIASYALPYYFLGVFSR